MENMSRTSVSPIAAILISLSLLFCALSPALASAQTATGSANATTQTTGSAAQSNAPGTCSISWSGGINLNFTACIWIPLMSWLGSWFLTIGGFALVLSGVLFDWLVQYIIIQFGSTLATIGAIAAITTGWDIFRDISNIIIIGMFTFIAIMTILGNTEYGYRKMLARVLVVAVLINFSLLFSKVIIDVGNYTSYQIYSAMAASPQFQASVQGSGGSQFDIASAFLRPMGITSIWNTQGVLQQFGQTTQSGVQAFAVGLVGGLLLLMLAIVLLYGCFLIAARAVTLVILMVTASIAFASYLHPTLSQSQFGWKGWWRSLLNASLFGPLLMLFLAFSLLIVNGANCAAQGSGASANCAAASANIQNGGIGTAVFNAMTNPTQSVNNSAAGWTVVMLYIFGIGLLFISFRLASSFASSVGGLSIGQDVWNRFANGAAAGVSGAGRFFGRNTAGRSAYNIERSQNDLAQQKRAEAAQARLNGKLADAEALEKAANSHARKAAVAGTLSSGYKKVVQKRAAEVAAVVQKTQPSKEVRNAQADAVEGAKTAAKASAEEMAKTLKETQTQAAASADIVKKELEKEIASNPDLKATHEKNTGAVEKENADAVKKISDKYADQVKQITEEINRGGITNARKNDLQKQLLESKGSRDSELRHETERVEKARRVALLNTANSEAAQKVMERNEALRTAAQELKVLNLSEDEETKRIEDIEIKRAEAKAMPGAKEMREAHVETTNAMAGRVASNQIGYFGNQAANGDDVAKAARAKLKTDREDDNTLKKVINSQIEQQSKKEE